MSLIIYPNRSPVKEYVIPAQDIIAGAPYSYTIPDDAFTEPDGEPMTFTGSATPDASVWLTFDPSTKTFYGTPRANEDAGDISINMWADDNNTSTTSTNGSFLLRIAENMPPEIDQGLSTPTNVTTHFEFTYTVPTDAFKDPEGDDITISVEIVDGNFLLNYDPTTRIITGTPSDNTKIGINVVRFTVTASNTGATLIHDMNIDVSENLPPTVSGSPSDAPCIIAHYPFTHIVSKSLFSEPELETMQWTLSTNETSKDSWLSMSETGSDLIFSGTPTNAQNGNYTANIIVTDGHTDTGNATTTFEI